MKIRNEKIENMVRELLEENGYKCNADGRKFIADRVGSLEPRDCDCEINLGQLYAAERIGGCQPREIYNYINARGTLSTARVCGLYKLPEDMVNPVLVCFSGMMTAHLCAFEIIRFYAKQHDKLLPLLAIGKGGNKGLFESVFNREQGIMIGSEYNAYLNALEHLAPCEYVRANERVCRDIDTAGNFDELYQFAKESGHREVTFILCSGNFSYDKRLLAEFMLKAKDPQYKDVKMNLVVAHCPIITNLKVIDGHPSEIMLGYIAAALGPLKKDTVTFEGKTKSAHPERYLMPGIAEADWSILRSIIREFNNMGWPNYAELLYGESHEDAVFDIIMSDLHARGSFSGESYDRELLEDLKTYQDFIGKFTGKSLKDFKKYLKRTTDLLFPFNKEIKLYNLLKSGTNLSFEERKHLGTYYLDKIKKQTNNPNCSWIYVSAKVDQMEREFGMRF